ncbi:MAP3K12-binding inhibitory protein 1-like [Glandiceps talaboti]
MTELLLATKVLGSMQIFLQESHLDRVCGMSINQEQLQVSTSLLTTLNSLTGQVEGLISSLQQVLSEVNQRQIKVEQNHTDMTMEGEECDIKPDISKIDPSLIQINASKSEIERRIASFMERKQVEVNDNNRREFCGIIDLTEEDDSCARTDAVFKPRSGGKSHVKVSKVVNPHGPQTRLPASPMRSRPQPSTSTSSTQHKTHIPGGVEERLSNMEKHLKIGMGHPVPKDVYTRIKRLEDRVLQLEGLSPEYFNAIPFAYKRQRRDSDQGDGREMSITEIDQRMKELQDSLLRKQQSIPQPKTEENMT